VDASSATSTKSGAMIESQTAIAARNPAASAGSANE
jgi:hypothetical protein